MRIMVIFGTRPEAIKLAPVLHQLGTRPEFVTKVCVTAQHRSMLDQMLELFEIRPDYDLDLMQEDQSLFQITANALGRIEGVLRKEAPDVVLVQGDTTTTFAAALAAYYLRIRVGHVEAGLRTGDPYNPFPEEMNRRLADVLSDWCFAPTEKARQNLLAEGTPPQKVFVTGNTVVDALQLILRRQSEPAAQQELDGQFAERYGVPLEPGVRLILVTGHRRESFGPEFRNICWGLRMIAERNDRVRIVYPVHLNPNVRGPVFEILGDVSRVHLLEPLDYATFVWLLNRCYLVLTDSGGIQEEGPALGKPVLVLRWKTERPEGVEAGVAELVGTDRDSIFNATQRLLHDPDAYRRMANRVDLYGDGHAAERIAEILLRVSSNITFL